MKLFKSMALMTIGGAMVVAYQKYKKPVMKAMNDARKKAMEFADEALDDMM